MAKKTAVVPQAPRERKTMKRTFVIQMKVGKAWEDIEAPVKNVNDGLTWLRKNAAAESGEPTIQPGVYRVARVSSAVSLAVQTVSKAVFT